MFSAIIGVGNMVELSTRENNNYHTDAREILRFSSERTTSISPSENNRKYQCGKKV
jgi:hypothetical protein